MPPTLICVYARKYEPQWLVDDLRVNVGWVDGFCELDQRNRVGELWSPRAERVAALQGMAREVGADWILHMDPDERLELEAERVVRRAVKSKRHYFSFVHRELFTPTAYRIDGIWGKKTRRRLYRIAALPLSSRRRRTLNVNLYHLKMIEPANRALRAQVFTQANTWDNKRRGFDYLADEDGMILEEIPDGRGFNPAYRPYRFEVPESLLDG